MTEYKKNGKDVCLKSYKDAERHTLPYGNEAWTIKTGNIMSVGMR
jgi:hypothetical protein